MLENSDVWALAVDSAIGKLLDAFIVTNHKDSLLLRDCSREANYRNIQIIIYDFSVPRYLFILLCIFHLLSALLCKEFFPCGYHVQAAYPKGQASSNTSSYYYIASAN